MNRNKTVKKNLDLHAEWMRYCFEHPEVLDKIPQGAQLVILPDNDRSLAAENRKIVNDLRAKRLPVVVIHLNLPKPQIEVLATHS